MKKVLIITYYWPPAGGPGVQRWLNFVKYLKKFQIDPIVYIPSNPDYPLLDQTLEEEVPKDITILRNKIFEPYFLARIFSRKQTKTISSGIIAEDNNQNFLQKFMLYVRGNFFIPDARKFWIKPSTKFLAKYLSENNISTIITTGPPHSLHLIGLQLKEKVELNWIADFRDPWTEIGYHKKLKLTETSEAKHLKLEKLVLKKASHIITTSFTTKKEFEEKTKTPVSVITNGFDQINLPEEVPDSKFSIAHIGSLLSGRNPKNLWKVLGELIKANLSFSKDFQLNLVGAVSEEVLNSIRDAGLGQHIKIFGYIPHPEAVKFQRRSQVLLLVEIDSRETRGIIPGKLFEYMGAKRPVIAVGPPQWDVDRILQETGSGNAFGYNDEEDLKYLILSYYNSYKKGELYSNSRNIDKYTRRNLTGKLAEVLNRYN